MHSQCECCERWFPFGQISSDGYCWDCKRKDYERCTFGANEPSVQLCRNYLYFFFDIDLTAVMVWAEVCAFRDQMLDKRVIVTASALLMHINDSTDALISFALDIQQNHDVNDF